MADGAAVVPVRFCCFSNHCTEKNGILSMICNKKSEKYMNSDKTL